MEVTIETRLIDRVDRTKTHRDGGEFPELRHQSWVRVRGETASGVRELLSETIELSFAQPTFKECAGIHSRARVPLEEDLIATAGMLLATEEVIEANFIHRSRGCEGRDMSTDADTRSLCAMDEERGVPTDEGTDPSLDHLVTGELRFALRRDGVHVIGDAKSRDVDPLLVRSLEKCEGDVAGAVGTGVLQDGVEGGVPFGGLGGIDIDELVYDVVRNLVDLGCAHGAIFPTVAPRPKSTCSGCFPPCTSRAKGVDFSL